jgi:hypothetical protein
MPRNFGDLSLFDRHIKDAIDMVLVIQKMAALQNQVIARQRRWPRHICTGLRVEICRRNHQESGQDRMKTTFDSRQRNACHSFKAQKSLCVAHS